MKPSFRWIIFTIPLLLNILSFAQSPEWSWVNIAGGITDDKGLSLKCDKHGFVYVTGYFRTSVLQIGNQSINNAGFRDVFLAKFDTLGNVIWAQSFGGKSSDKVKCLEVDCNGNVYILGEFMSPILHVGTFQLNSGNKSQVFLAKIDSEGNVLWTMASSGSSNPTAGSVTTDYKGYVYVSCNYQHENCYFGVSAFENMGEMDFFLIKLDPFGVPVWSKSFGGALSDECTSLCCNGESLFIGGNFKSETLAFGNTIFENSGNADPFIVKCLGSGETVWGYSGKGSENDYCNALSSDAFGSVFITGSYRSHLMNFGSAYFVNNGNPNINDDYYLLKIDSTGNFLWSDFKSSPSDEAGKCLSVDNSNNLLVSGYYLSDSITFGSNTLINNGLNNAFITKYTSEGNIEWAKTMGGAHSDYLNGITTDLKNNIYTTGYLKSPVINFDQITITNGGPESIFVARLNSFPTAIAEFQASPLFRLFPNPTRHIVNYETGLSGQWHFSLFNQIGKGIFQVELLKPSGSFYLPLLPCGLYFYKASSKSQIISGKLVIY